MEKQVTLPLQQESSSGRSWRELWDSLVQPSPHLQGDDRRKATNLSMFLVVLFPLSVVTVFQAPIASWLAGDSPIVFNFGGFGGLILVIAAYFLSRTRYYVWAAYCVIATPFIAIVLANVNNPAGVSPTSYFFLSLGVLFASLLLGWKETIIAGILSSLSVVVMSMMGGVEVPLANLTFLALTTGVPALVSQIRDQFIADLQVSQEALRQQVIETEDARLKAERSDQVKSAFLASMSHELRTPLNAIINFSKFVAKGDLGPVNEEQQETLFEVVDSAKHLLNLINDVLDMSKIESGSLNLFVTDDVDLQTILQQVASTSKGLLVDKEVAVETDVPDTLPNIRGDRQRLVQVFLNIMSNACKFTEEGKITVRAYQQGADVMIKVSDTGPGIAPEDQDSVFEAFKQTESGLRQGGGTGLGMPITRSLVEAHGGKIELESQAGQGATFIISLPIKSDQLVPTLS